MITKIKFKIHPLFYLTSFICFITGNFKDFVIFTSIIIIHELGHIVGALICNWNIEKVILLPFGGITIFKEHLNKSLKQELLITILGPSFQLIFYFLYKNNPNFSNFNNLILFFNLLPIYPLDGSKIINILLNRLFSFKFSHKMTIFISIITLIILILLGIKYNLLIILILIFLIIELIKEIYKHKYYFNKFLLERYLYNFKFKRNKIIKNINQMKKETKHILYVDKKYCTEKEILMKMFDN